ncbi:Glycosyltransferase involved in cell wall bisynthesis [Tenacibaculum sp. MAR_2009_124]|uniref:glycosyltransferase family 4 protein n=1 Tax=Tenacibaculum sp. MAR_2009_124 TaxID=1250059 RepID=UPI000898AF9F|nr:glycosyltransferase family 1 protein [Tenacibaculum sp. MAR_2009_124]SEB42613.1 Glycosyltransferase involved in cell wall bisynthesis [Tenacibaculum sp. MAR_2009_124]
MKIGFDAKRIFHNTTGLGNYSRDLVRILDRYCPSNSYYLYNPKPKKVKRLKLESSMTEVLPNTWFGKKLSSLWRQKGVITQIKSDNIDIFHGLSGEIPRKLRENGIKSVVTIHDLIFMRYPEWYSYFDRKIHFSKFKYAAENADCVIAISEQTKMDIITYLKIPESKIKVVYQGCHNAFKVERTNEEKESLKKKLKLPERFLLNVGTIEKRKNALTIIKTLKNINVPLVIVGRKTKYFQEIEQYISQNNLEKKVIFLEGLTMEQLSTLYQLAEIFIYPSVFEGFGIPIIEALFSKTPVITTDSGVFPEAGGKYSRYVNPTDVTAMENEIKLLLSSSELRAEIAGEGFKYAQKFNDKDIATSMNRIYSNI